MSRVRMKQFLSIVLLITFLLSQVNITLASKQGDGIKYSSVKSVKAKHGKNLDKLIEASVRKAVGVKNKSKVVLTVAAPSDNLEVNQNFVTVSGSTEYGNTVKVNGVAVSTDLTGAFSKIVTNLPPGTNTITIIATDKAGNSTTISRTVKTPCVSITAPADNFQSNQPTVTVTGRGPVGGTVTVNGDRASIDTLGNFTGTVNLIPGINSITITGTDTKGYNTTLTRTVIYRAPTLTISAPGDNLQTNFNTVTVAGRVEAGIASLTVNGSAITPDAYGNFSYAYSLSKGTNIISITANGVGGLSTTVTRTVVYVSL
jgi:hypothetical protein